MYPIKHTAVAPALLMIFASTSGHTQDASKVTFAADARGRLVLEGTTRVHLEMLLALYTPEQQQQILQSAKSTLPRAADQELLKLVHIYPLYQSALRKRFPPGQTMSSPDEGLAQLDATHAIEVQYFGERATTGLFGEDESTQRQLLTLMRQDNTPGLTMEQRADRAQEHYDQLHQTAVAK
jgi:hypothetical protein